MLDQCQLPIVQESNDSKLTNYLVENVKGFTPEMRAAVNEKYDNASEQERSLYNNNQILAARMLAQEVVMEQGAGSGVSKPTTTPKTNTNQLASSAMAETGGGSSSIPAATPTDQQLAKDIRNMDDKEFEKGMKKILSGQVEV